MIKTRFTELVGCSVPIQQAGMGILANPALALAVADAGGRGNVSNGGLPPDVEVHRRVLDEVTASSRGPIGYNIIRLRDSELQRQLVANAAQRVRVVDLFWPEPDCDLAGFVKLIHAGGALACLQVGSREEAINAVEAGCDLVVAQGYEAGGHVRGTIGLLPLLDEVLDAVDVPVIAAGGIGGGRAIAAALAAGASAVRIGTRFIAAEEAQAHPVLLDALYQASAADTVHTEVFNVGWPDAPHRVLRSSVEEAQRFEGDVVAEWTSEYTGARRVLRRLEGGAVPLGAVGHIEALPNWAGEGVNRVRKLQPAAEIIRDLMQEAEELLGVWGGRIVPDA